MTFALTFLFFGIAGVTIALFDLGPVPAAVLCGLAIALVKVVSKRPEFDGLPPPAE